MNKLRSIPKELGKLTQLTALWLNNNQLHPMTILVHRVWAAANRNKFVIMAATSAGAALLMAYYRPDLIEPAANEIFL